MKENWKKLYGSQIDWIVVKLSLYFMSGKDERCWVMSDHTLFYPYSILFLFYPFYSYFTILLLCCHSLPILSPSDNCIPILSFYHSIPILFLYYHSAPVLLICYLPILPIINVSTMYPQYIPSLHTHTLTHSLTSVSKNSS